MCPTPILWTTKVMPWPVFVHVGEGRTVSGRSLSWKAPSPSEASESVLSLSLSLEDSELEGSSGTSLSPSPVPVFRLLAAEECFRDLSRVEELSFPELSSSLAELSLESESLSAPPPGGTKGAKLSSSSASESSSPSLSDPLPNPFATGALGCTTPTSSPEGLTMGGCFMSTHTTSSEASLQSRRH